MCGTRWDGWSCPRAPATWGCGRWSRWRGRCRRPARTGTWGRCATGRSARRTAPTLWPPPARSPGTDTLGDWPATHVTCLEPLTNLFAIVVHVNSLGDHFKFHLHFNPPGDLRFFLPFEFPAWTDKEFICIFVYITWIRPTATMTLSLFNWRGHSELATSISN